ncbi:MAG: hypothetical protein NC218_01785 [Acetobacter sp.]|nr:hypothetical protein [Acetobacter sp.]
MTKETSYGIITMLDELEKEFTEQGKISRLVYSVETDGAIELHVIRTTEYPVRVTTSLQCIVEAAVNSDLPMKQILHSMILSATENRRL